MQLTPIGFSWSCSARVRFSSSEMTPRTISFAGALWTPRSPSLRAQIPAMWPDGGTNAAWPAIGSKTLIHGQYSVAYFES